MFAYVQYDVRVPDNLKEKFEAFPLIFKNTLVSRSDFQESIKKYAEGKKRLTQPRRLLAENAHNSVGDCMNEEEKETWNIILKNDCSSVFSANSTSVFSPRTCCERHIKHDKGEPGLFKEDEIICLCSKTYICFHKSTDKVGSAATVPTNGR